jgi:predicted outer membrane lipoprotein
VVYDILVAGVVALFFFYVSVEAIKAIERKYWLRAHLHDIERGLHIMRHDVTDIGFFLKESVRRFPGTGERAALVLFLKEIEKEHMAALSQSAAKWGKQLEDIVNKDKQISNLTKKQEAIKAAFAVMEAMSFEELEQRCQTASESEMADILNNSGFFGEKN